MVGKLCAGIKLSAISIGWQPKQKRNIKTQNILRVTSLTWANTSAVHSHHWRPTCAVRATTLCRTALLWTVQRRARPRDGGERLKCMACHERYIDSLISGTLISPRLGGGNRTDESSASGKNNTTCVYIALLNSNKIIAPPSGILNPNKRWLEQW